ncbi:lactonase family protein [Sediminibacterium ginsengisoli]|uniref:6-phosphogluconolactonase n=1 Tax=Sediminibacterium ginsengisoli TaxID=413434 RepID=A0A1T4L1W4_9BACT|nr:lactonase family protein [Sediminibacterium ginsengisoli]SJZ48588.1 6-phosphogluconolactonase [Sediminibacterium ginsengisoli]
MRFSAFLITCVLLTFQANAQQYYLFAGTYTNANESKGIYVYKFDAETGAVTWISNTDSCTNPSYITLSRNGKYLYSVNETGRDKPGRVSAFSFSKSDGSLTLLNTQPSGGDDPCFVTTDKKGKWLFAANYSGGNLSAFRLNKNGSLQPYTQLIQHQGSSINQKRQDKAHVHSTFITPDQRYILAADLGMDIIARYHFDENREEPLKRISSTAVEAGSGPRHIAFHPRKSFVYLISELSGTVTVYADIHGGLIKQQTIATHPDDFKGQPGSADIHLSPDGHFLYASNRGEENNLAIFSVDKKSGLLTKVGYQAIPGTGPRNFIIDPKGKFLLVANQKTNNIVIYKRDEQTGLLQQLPQQVNLPAPVCLQLLKMK